MSSSTNRINSLARAAAHRPDVIVASFVVLAIVMIVIPLPTALVDVLIAVNMAISLLILVVAFYIGRPGEFSSLPPIILIATLFRLALSITTTRLILLQANAGDIVATFGRFVIGNEIIVGLVVFLIITAAQFIVITKGSERVAEVAARFSLDAMPGKQMSIDNDLRNGDIDSIEARARRARLERESQLYGAMDGAMKFVKGDAITGLIIVAVNLVGGLLIGTLTHGMSFSDAAHRYSLLTVGDGLIAQIPALLISIAAGTVVTRVAPEHEGDLGTEIFNQLGNSSRALSLASIVLLGAGLVPGFPTLIFTGLGLFFAFSAWATSKRRRKQSEWVPSTDIVAATVPTAEPAVAEVHPTSQGTSRNRVMVFVGTNLSRVISPETFQVSVDRVRSSLADDLGIDALGAEMRSLDTLPAGGFRIDLEGVPIAEGEIPVESLLVRDDPLHLDVLEVSRRERANLDGARGMIWIDQAHATAIKRAGIDAFTSSTVLEKVLSVALRRHAAHFLGIQETRELLSAMEGSYPELVKEALRAVPIQRLSDVLRRLVEEDVGITNLRIILEALVEWGGRDTETVTLTERVRAALCRQISHKYAKPNRVIAACVLTRATENAAHAAVSETSIGRTLILPDEFSQQILLQIRDLYEECEGPDMPVIITSVDLRRMLRNFLLRHDMRIPVMSYQEIAAGYSVQSVMQVSHEISDRGGLSMRTPRVTIPLSSELVPADLAP